MRILPVLMLCIALPALAQRAPAPPEGQHLRPGMREGFAVDDRNGCWAWMSGMPRTATEFSLRWTGTCPNGPAEGPGRSTFTWREGGTERQMVHEGTMQAGKAVGRGSLAHIDDGEPVVLETGDFADDMLVRGRIEVPRHGLVYEGEVRRGRPHGRGRLTLDGRQVEGEWQEGCLALPGGVWVAFGRSAESCRTEES